MITSLWIKTLPRDKTIFKIVLPRETSTRDLKPPSLPLHRKILDDIEFL